MKKKIYENKVIMVQLLVVLLIVASYVSNRNLCLLAAIIGFFYILFSRDDIDSIALILFVLPFSSIFNIADGTTSLFMFFRIACVFRLITKKNIPKQYFCLLLCLVIYSILSMLIGNTFALFRISNLVLWFLVGLSIILFYDVNKIHVWSRSLSQGLILACVIGLNLDLIPNLKNSLIVASYLSSSSGTIVSRFSALWNDPNGLTVFLIVSMFLNLIAMNLRKLKSVEFYIYILLQTIFGLLTLSKSCMILLILFWAYLFLSKSQMRLFYKMLVFIMGIITLLFINKYMSSTISEIIARFTSVSSSESLTSGRSDLWELYFENMDLLVWVFGKGINAALPLGKAAHNTIIQLIYNIGIVGMMIWIRLFVEQSKLYHKKSSGYRRIWMPILAIVMTMLFLDGMFLELFYILIPVLLCTSYRPY